MFDNFDLLPVSKRLQFLKDLCFFWNLNIFPGLIFIFFAASSVVQRWQSKATSCNLCPPGTSNTAPGGSSAAWSSVTPGGSDMVSHPSLDNFNVSKRTWDKRWKI